MKHSAKRTLFAAASYLLLGATMLATFVVTILLLGGGIAGVAAAVAFTIAIEKGFVELVRWIAMRTRLYPHVVSTYGRLATVEYSPFHVENEVLNL